MRADDRSSRQATCYQETRSPASEVGTRFVPILAGVPIDKGFLRVHSVHTVCTTGEHMARDPHLIQRGRQYYLKLPVPRPLRRLALFVSSTGKPKDYLVEPLGPDYTPA